MIFLEKENRVDQTAHKAPKAVFMPLPPAAGAERFIGPAKSQSVSKLIQSDYYLIDAVLKHFAPHSNKPPALPAVYKLRRKPAPLRGLSYSPPYDNAPAAGPAKYCAGL